MTLVPKAIKGMAFRARELKYWVHKQWIHLRALGLDNLHHRSTRVPNCGFYYFGSFRGSGLRTVHFWVAVKESNLDYHKRDIYVYAKQYGVLIMVS